MINIPLLTPEDIEVKVKQITKNGALALIFKTARTDRRILNQVFGPLNWTSDYKMVKDNLYCGIGIRESADQDFVWKWDCGTESRSDDDGNEKKGEASDAFKRAGFQVGIGEELYSSPLIWLDVETVQRGDKWFLKDPLAKYVVTHVAYNEETRVITELEICNAKTSVVVFNWRLPSKGAIAKKMTRTMAPVSSTDTDDTPPWEDSTPAASTSPETPKKTAKSEGAGSSTEAEKLPLKQLISSIGSIVKSLYTKNGNATVYNNIVKEVSGSDTFKCNAATEADYDVVNEIYRRLMALEKNG